VIAKEFAAKFTEIQSHANVELWAVLELWLKGNKNEQAIGKEIDKHRVTAGRKIDEICNHFFGTHNRHDRQERKNLLISEFQKYKPSFLHEELREHGAKTNTHQIPDRPVPSSDDPPTNLADKGRDSNMFFGRGEQLDNLNEELESHKGISITAVSGMGGIGKSEFAIQYGKKFLNEYSGGVWWLSAQAANLLSEIISITKLRFPEFSIDLLRDLSETAKVDMCWQQWVGKGRALIIFDDIVNFRNTKPYLPQRQDLVVLITTRDRLDNSIRSFPLDELSKSAALDLLAAEIGKPIEAKDLTAATNLCEQLGYLPLALELVGKYLALDDISIDRLILELQAKGMKHFALEGDVENWTLTAERGIAAAFELSWQKLKTSTKHLAKLLSIFDLLPFEWKWVESTEARFCREDIPPREFDSMTLSQSRHELIKRSLLKTGKTEEESTYNLHPLIRQFCREKLEGKR